MSTISVWIFSVYGTIETRGGDMEGTTWRGHGGGGGGCMGERGGGGRGQIQAGHISIGMNQSKFLI